MNKLIQLMNWDGWDFATKWLVYDFGILRTAGIAHVGIGLGYLTKPDVPTVASAWGIDNIYYAAFFIFVGGGAFAKGRFMQPFASIKSNAVFVPLFVHAIFTSMQIYEGGGGIDPGALYLAFCVLLVQVSILIYRQDMPDIDGRLDLYLSDLFKKVKKHDTIPRTDQ